MWHFSWLTVNSFCECLGVLLKPVNPVGCSGDVISQWRSSAVNCDNTWLPVYLRPTPSVLPIFCVLDFFLLRNSYLHTPSHVTCGLTPIFCVRLCSDFCLTVLVRPPPPSSDRRVSRKLVLYCGSLGRRDAIIRITLPSEWMCMIRRESTPLTPYREMGAWFVSLT